MFDPKKTWKSSLWIDGSNSDGFKGYPTLRNKNVAWPAKSVVNMDKPASVIENSDYPLVI
jgi:hypothetical protein